MYFKIMFLFSLIFFFTSCSDNSNKIQLPNKCYEKGITGKCRAYFIKYEYSQEKGKCQEFVYGGCGGNIPFNTLNECQKSCEE